LGGRHVGHVERCQHRLELPALPAEALLASVIGVMQLRRGSCRQLLRQAPLASSRGHANSLQQHQHRAHPEYQRQQRSDRTTQHQPGDGGEDEHAHGQRQPATGPRRLRRRVTVVPTPYIDLGIEGGTKLRQLHLQRAGPFHAAAQLCQRPRSRHLALEAVGLRLQLSRTLESLVAILGVDALDGQTLCAACFLKVGGLEVELRVERLATLIGLYPGGAVSLKPLEGGFAIGQLTLEHADLFAHDLEQARILVTLGAVAVDRRLQLLLGLARAAIGSTDGLLESVLDGRLVTGDLG